MIIKVDCREKKLFIELEKSLSQFGLTQHFALQSVNLPLGDIILMDEKENELLIIERKTLKDLSSSIKDNRYIEQSFRLDECKVPNHNIIYLIEGNLSTFHSNYQLDKKTLWSSMFSLLYFKGFSVIMFQAKIRN